MILEIILGVALIVTVSIIIVAFGQDFAYFVGRVLGKMKLKRKTHAGQDKMSEMVDVTIITPQEDGQILTYDIKHKDLRNTTKVSDYLPV